MSCIGDIKINANLIRNLSSLRAVHMVFPKKKRGMRPVSISDAASEGSVEVRVVDVADRPRLLRPDEKKAQGHWYAKYQQGKKIGACQLPVPVGTLAEDRAEGTLGSGEYHTARPTFHHYKGITAELTRDELAVARLYFIDRVEFAKVTGSKNGKHWANAMKLAEGCALGEQCINKEAVF